MWYFLAIVLGLYEKVFHELSTKRSRPNYGSLGLPFPVSIVICIYAVANAGHLEWLKKRPNDEVKNLLTLRQFICRSGKTKKPTFSLFGAFKNKPKNTLRAKISDCRMVFLGIGLAKGCGWFFRKGMCGYLWKWRPLIHYCLGSSWVLIIPRNCGANS